MSVFYTVLVAEVTMPSLGVGYEIGRAVAMDKNILCLYRYQPEKRKKINKSTMKKMDFLSIICFASGILL